NWSNYAKVISELPYLSFYFNTVVMTLVKIIGLLFLSSLAAYAFARIEFTGRNTLFVIFLSIMMIPEQILLVPHYQIMVHLEWLNTIKALILPGMFSAWATFLLRQFF